MINRKNIALLFLIFSAIFSLLFIHEYSVLKSILNKDNSGISYYDSSTLLIYFAVTAFLLILSSAFLWPKNKLESSHFSKKMNQEDIQQNFSEKNHDSGNRLKEVSISKGEDISSFYKDILSELSNKLEVIEGIGYELKNDQLIATETFACNKSKDELRFELGDGLVGTAAKDKKVISTASNEAKEGKSGLGNSHQLYLSVFPVIKENQVIGVLEIATFKEIRKQEIDQLSSLCKI